MAPKYGSYRTIQMPAAIVSVLKKAKSAQEKTLAEFGDHVCHYYIEPKDENKLHGEITDTPTATTKEIFFVNTDSDLGIVQDRRTQHVGRIIHNELGIKEYNFHSLRHSNATLLAENGADVKEIQTRLGHKDIKATIKHYIHLTEKMETKSLNIVNALNLNIS